jgi:predicted esterase
MIKLKKQINKTKLLLLFTGVILFSSGIVAIAQSNSEVEIIIETNEDERSARWQVWREYMMTQSQDIERLTEMASRQITFGDATMRFTYFIIGEPDANGFPLYIAMHGGGQTPINERQYEHMQIYYRESVKNGIYVAVRGVRDTWNTHFNDESFPIYDRLIENMILLRNVDPNRVYLMGFSAGGDGVYGITPRMPDRFAAVSMSAGHHNQINVYNFQNTPILLQCGDRDTAFERHLETARFGVKMTEMQKRFPGFEHQVNMQVNKGHNFADNSAARNPQWVWENSETWLTGQPTDSVLVNTNAIDFLDKYVRNPLPTSVVWDLTIRAGERSVESFYWLRADKNMTEGLIIASYDKRNNTITITTEGVKAPFSVLLNRTMLNFDRPITLIVNGNRSRINVSSSHDVIVETTNERGDLNFQFSAIVEINP